MAESPSVLGIFLSGNDLFYALRAIGDDRIRDVGSRHFNFDLNLALRNREEGLEAVRQAVKQLCGRHCIEKLHVQTDAADEIWATLQTGASGGKAAYADRLELLCHPEPLDSFIVDDMPAGAGASPMLVMKRRSALAAYAPVIPDGVETRFISDVEAGSQMAASLEGTPSMLCIHASENSTAICRFTHGSLRQATRIDGSATQDLSYWHHHRTRLLPWMEFDHEPILIYGQNAFSTLQGLSVADERFSYAIVAEELVDAGLAIHPEAEPIAVGYPMHRGLPALLACAIP